MMKETVLSRSVRLMFVGGMALGFGVLAQPAFAQEDTSIQRVEITGSSIKRIAAEGALPVVTMRAEDIQASGVTSMVDLVKKLSSAQGATGESSSVGGGSFGFSGISIHNIGETRTLVLLNGKRLAQFGGQSLTGFGAGVDLNSIPISSIERVEILTDGASALYGADAIAGVVNFITKRNNTDGDVTIGYSYPKGGAAVEKRISATKGFGTLEQNGFNVLLSFGHDERTQMFSTDRSFSGTGRAFFSRDGKQYRIQQYSVSPIPANAIDDLDQFVSPWLATHGSCPEKTFRVTESYAAEDGSPRTDDYCGFDFVGELEVYPERKRDNFMASVTKKIGDHELYGDLLLSRTKQISRIAPVPGNIQIAAGSALHNQYLLPIGITGTTTAAYRLYDLGKRTNSDTAEFANFVVGSRGELMGWDYNAGYSHSVSDVKGNIAGYPGALAVRGLTQSGLLDPFVGPGQQSPAAQQAINAIAYNGYWDGGTSKLDSVTVSGSRELTKMAAGPLMLGAGFNVNHEKFESKPSLFAQGLLSDPVAGTLCDGTAANPCDQRFGDASAVPPYSASRTSKGLFGELIIPVMKSLELGLAARYDNYSDFGNAETAKASFRWTPTNAFLLRGSVATGFHAPTVPQVKAAIQSFGVTGGDYTCTPELAAIAAAQGAVCQPGSRQYDQLAGGNADLQPEKSRQATLGFRFEPTNNISFGADLWHVAIRDSFGQLTEEVAFGNPTQYPSAWSSQVDVGTGVNYLAFLASNANLGKSYTTGVDIDVSAKMKTTFGNLSSQLTATHMLREVSQLQKDGPYFSAIGNFAELGTVTFRTQGRWATTLKTEKFAHTLGVNFKSGYRDLETTVEVLDATGAVTGTEDIRMNVGWFTTFDWQTQWTPTKNWAITAGVLNLLDKDPPFVISSGGANRGQQFGYDDRYYDPRGRTLYVNASYKF
jgi:iron complex outermembrane recepter protein